MKLLVFALTTALVASCTQNPYRTISTNRINSGNGNICWLNQEEKKICESSESSDKSECAFSSIASCDSPIIVKVSRSCAKSLFEKYGHTKTRLEAVELHNQCMLDNGWLALYGSH